MNRITEFAVSRRSVTLLLAAALFVTGIYGWGNLQQELLPDIEFPVITVIAPYPGAGASDVTDQVTKPIERAISGVTRLERIQSTSANSIAVVVATFSFGTNVKEARAAIESNLTSVGLPQGVSPQVTALNINQSPVIIASIATSSDADLAAAGRIVRTDIVPALQGLDGVGSVDVTGGLEQRVTVTLDSTRLALAGTSVQQVVGALQTNNLTLPAGQLPSESASVPVSTIGVIGSVDDVRNLVVKIVRPNAQAGTGTGAGATGSGTSGGGIPSAQLIALAGLLGIDPASLPAVLPDEIPVTIGMLGTVEVTSTPSTGYARTDGNPSITITVSKTTGANTVSVADRVTEALAAAQARNPSIRIKTVSDLSGFIKESRDGLVREGGLGAVFAILTIFLFLFSLRSTIVAAVSIPLSILAALVLMQVTGVSMNIMTLGGLAVAVGRVVDDAIVVLENIYRHRALGEDRRTAVLNGAREVAGAITASTVTTVAVFLPLGFVGGLVSQFFLPFALTVTFALLASLLCALTVVPVARVLPRRPGQAWRSTRPASRSGRSGCASTPPLIRFALRSRCDPLGGRCAAPPCSSSGSLALAPGHPDPVHQRRRRRRSSRSTSPRRPATSSDRRPRPDDRGRDDPACRPERGARSRRPCPGEGDTGFQTLTAAFSGRPANSASIRIKLPKSTDLKVYTKQVAEALAPIKHGRLRRHRLRGHRLLRRRHQRHRQSVRPRRSSPRRATRSSTALRGQRRPDQREERPRRRARPRSEVTVDPNKAVGAGLTAAQVAGRGRGPCSVPSAATRIQLDGEPALDLFVRIDPAAVDSVDELARPAGRDVRQGPARLDRRRRAGRRAGQHHPDRPGARVVDLGRDHQRGHRRRVAGRSRPRSTRSRPAATIPAGVDVELAGVTQQQSEAFGGLFLSMGVAILLVYVMMVLTFNSLITPFIILFSLPLATIGAFPALYFTGTGRSASAPSSAS